jgi:hypothetical protein
MLDIQFGSGVATFTPNAGNLAANPTPIRLKVLQEASIEFKGDLKKLFGQSQLAVATARGKIDVTGKAKVAALNANDINQIYWGQAVSAGGNRPYDEIHAIAATITPTLGTGLAVTDDQGVINMSTGLNMVKIAGAPGVGQYEFTPAVTGGSPTAAIYTFNAADVTSAFPVKLSFRSSSTTLGSTLTLNNQLMGYAPVCQLVLWNQFRGALDLIQLNSVTLGMFSKPTKQEDFWVADIDFSCNADVNDVLGLLYTD